ncbi:MAG: hypothetical protein KA807_01385 [Prolixibacteraceae bacterium]|nr:hypothetical protein [Prolixibacteraceae bacterium]
MIKNILLIPIFLLLFSGIYANSHYDIIVAKDGSGNYTSLTEAINNLPMYQYQRCVIYIKNGIYEEKIRIEQNYVTIVGESRDSTIIRYSQLRTDWQNNKDFIGPAVINIHADDIILKNLTIENTQPQIGPHAFTIYGTGTRTIILNCKVTSKGGDTVSLWNYKSGMYYHSDCYFEGAVDFVCPRGWCFIRKSSFYEVKQTAAIWHAAPENKNQKFVLLNCSFDGVEGFNLGRHHYEACFYLINCMFSRNMANRPIYHEISGDPSKDRPYFYGDRHYYHNCKKEGEVYKWYADNMKINPDIVTPEWTFDKQWDPESSEVPKVNQYKIDNKNLYLYFNSTITVRGKLILKTSTGKILIFKKGEGRDILRFESEQPLNSKDLKNNLSVVSGQILDTQASVKERVIADIIIIP